MAPHRYMELEKKIRSDPRLSEYFWLRSIYSSSLWNDATHDDKIDFIATWTSPLERNSIYISKISETDNAKFNKIKPAGDRQYC